MDSPIMLTEGASWSTLFSCFDPDPSVPNTSVLRNEDEIGLSSSLCDGEDVDASFLSQPAQQSLPIVYCPGCKVPLFGPAYHSHREFCPVERDRVAGHSSRRKLSPRIDDGPPVKKKRLSPVDMSCRSATVTGTAACPKGKSGLVNPVGQQGKEVSIGPSPPTLPTLPTADEAVTPPSQRKRPLKSSPARPSGTNSPTVPSAGPPSKEKKKDHEPKRRVEVQYDPDRHCGVIIPEQKRPCTRSLSCKAHPLSKRRKVPNRKGDFDTMLAAHRAARAAERKPPPAVTATADHTGGKLPPEGDLQARSRLPLSLEINSGRSRNVQPPLDTPPSIERHIACRGEVSDDHDPLDYLLGDDDLIGSFDDVIPFMNTPTSQVSPMGRDDRPEFNTAAANSISLTEELARCFSAIPIHCFPQDNQQTQASCTLVRPSPIIGRKNMSYYTPPQDGTRDVSELTHYPGPDSMRNLFAVFHQLSEQQKTSALGTELRSDLLAYQQEYGYVHGRLSDLSPTSQASSRQDCSLDSLLSETEPSLFPFATENQHGSPVYSSSSLPAPCLKYSRQQSYCLTSSQSLPRPQPLLGQDGPWSQQPSPQHSTWGVASKRSCDDLASTSGDSAACPTDFQDLVLSCNSVTPAGRNIPPAQCKLNMQLHTFHQNALNRRKPPSGESRIKVESHDLLLPVQSKSVLSAKTCRSTPADSKDAMLDKPYATSPTSSEAAKQDRQPLAEKNLAGLFAQQPTMSPQQQQQQQQHSKLAVTQQAFDSQIDAAAVLAEEQTYLSLESADKEDSLLSSPEVETSQAQWPTITASSPMKFPVLDSLPSNVYHASQQQQSVQMHALQMQDMMNQRLQTWGQAVHLQQDYAWPRRARGTSAESFLNQLPSTVGVSQPAVLAAHSALITPPLAAPLPPVQQGLPQMLLPSSTVPGNKQAETGLPFQGHLGLF